jgi:hypothetical protein
MVTKAMFKAFFLLPLFILLSTSACGPQKQDERISSLESDVKQLKAEVIELKRQKATPEHHYELRNEGFRTFRFDPATGDTCIKLTTADDWKRKDTKSQSCECVDMTQQYFEMPRHTEEEGKAAADFWAWVRASCGR